MLKLMLFSLFLGLSSLFASYPSYSLTDCHGVPLDHKIVELFEKKTHGIFIEVGANNGISQSNTKLLEDYFGWKGILIEPAPSLFTSLCANRPNSICLQCALGPEELNNTYVYGDFNGDLMSSVNGVRLNRIPTEQVHMRSLQSILNEFEINHIDFMSLDTEGYEMKILQGIDFTKTTFDYLLIEIYKDQLNEICSFLSKNGYKLIENFSNYNLKDHPGWDTTHNDYLFKRSRDLF